MTDRPRRSEDCSDLSALIPAMAEHFRVERVRGTRRSSQTFSTAMSGEHTLCYVASANSQKRQVHVELSDMVCRSLRFRCCKHFGGFSGLVQKLADKCHAGHAHHDGGGARGQLGRGGPRGPRRRPAAAAAARHARHGGSASLT